MYSVVIRLLSFRTANGSLTNPTSYAERSTFVKITVEEYILFAWEVLAVGSNEFVGITGARSIYSLCFAEHIASYPEHRTLQDRIFIDLRTSVANTQEEIATQLGYCEKTMADINVQKTKLRLSIEKLEVSTMTNDNNVTIQHVIFYEFLTLFLCLLSFRLNLLSFL